MFIKILLKDLFTLTLIIMIDYNWIERYPGKVDWNDICTFAKLTEKFIAKHANYVQWDRVSQFQKLSESFIQKHYHLVNWNLIVIYQHLSVEFLDELNFIWNSSNWNNISSCQILTEEFITKYCNKLNWNNISQYQSLSESFLIQNENNIDWNFISEFQNLSPPFVLKYVLNDKIKLHILINNRQSWNNLFNDVINIVKLANHITVLNCFYDSPLKKADGYKKQQNIIVIKQLFNKLVSVNSSVIRIQQQWLQCYYNPQFLTCRKRLTREFEELNYFINSY